MRTELTAVAMTWWAFPEVRTAALAGNGLSSITSRLALVCTQTPLEESCPCGPPLVGISAPVIATEWKQVACHKGKQVLGRCLGEGRRLTSSHLPKMLNRKAIVTRCSMDVGLVSLSKGEAPDGSLRTWWRELPDDAALNDPALEVVLPETAELATLSSALLAYVTLLGLWTGSEITLKDVCAYLAGGHIVKIPRNGYEEPLIVPKVQRAAIEQAVGAAVSRASSG